jgi:hypothetical protein
VAFGHILSVTRFSIFDFFSSGDFISGDHGELAAAILADGTKDGTKDEGQLLF